MSISDWISLAGALASLVLTIVIAVVQYKQSKKIASMERSWDERDERRRAQEIKASAISFISRYYADRNLIPLCAIAAMYNPLFYYSRQMYRDFCCLTQETQNTILKYLQLDLKVHEDDLFYDHCLSVLTTIVKDYFPDDKDIFYDNGKYLFRSIDYYSSEAIPCKQFKYENHLTDVLIAAVRGEKEKTCPIHQLCVEYNFSDCSEVEACQLASMIAGYLALYTMKDSFATDRYGMPGDALSEEMQTMEDLFLWTMFRLYTHSKAMENSNEQNR